MTQLKSLKKVLALINEHDSAEWTVVTTSVMTQSGNNGWQSDYYANGRGVLRQVVDNCHSFSASYDIRDLGLRLKRAMAA